MIVDFDSGNIENLKKSERGFPLALTSGCFDLLHSGHIFFLSEVKKQLPQAAKLLVVLHSDTDISAHKGHDRPIFAAKHRLLLLDNLRQVDYVGVWRGWESIVDLVYKLEPEFLATSAESAKQTNWPDNWRVVAKKIGAQLIGIPRVDSDVSTSSFIKRIKALPQENRQVG